MVFIRAAVEARYFPSPLINIVHIGIRIMLPAQI